MSLLSLLFPPRCVLCRMRLPAGRTTELCPACAEAVRREYRQMDGVRIPETDGAAAALQYKGLVRAAMHRYKFRHMKGYYRWFAAYAAAALAEHMNDWKPELITFVPVSLGRLRTRGYDQSELLARQIAALTDIPCVPTLRKRPFRKRQSGQKSTARRKNVLGAFALRDGAAIAGKRVILVDDVLTTGATVGACAAVLREAGAAYIYALAVTKTP